MRTLVLTRGLPGSGKSTWAKEQVKKEPGKWKRANRDDLRAMLDVSVFSPENEEFITSTQLQMVRDALLRGFDVIVDDTNLNPMTVKKFYKLAESVGDVTVLDKPFNASVEVCLARNALREGTARVPDHVIENMARKAKLDGKNPRVLEEKSVYFPPVVYSKRDWNEELKPAILCDLDGTLAIINGRNPYDASRCDETDAPHRPVIACVEAMAEAGSRIIFMSGREDKYREPTIRFIEKHVALEEYELHMRSSGDFRKDSIVKGELFNKHVADKYNVQFVIDDRPSVVRFWRSIGLTVFAVDDREF